MARPYNKKNLQYWSSLSKTKTQNFGLVNENNDWEPMMVGEASYPSSSTSTRSNRITRQPALHRFSNIADGLTPFEYSSDHVDAKDAIELCQKAYYNFAVVRGTIDLMSEFANSELYLEGGSIKSRKFVNAWLKQLDINNTKDQFFREYFRSGNCFLYQLNTKIESADNREFLMSFAASNYTIPAKYLLLNPAEILINGSVSFDSPNYLKALTDFEAQRLKERKTERDREIYNALDKETQKLIDAGGGGSGIFITLKAEKLHTVFFKKQDYEPMAVPLCYSILDDINRKEELKKVDQAIARKINQVILLVTMGNEPDKGGINHRHLNAMRELFNNQSVSKVLVSDYTTKAEFIIPDLRKVVGEEKYKVLNRDILDGLQNMLLGESKFADMSMKLKVFMRRLNDARNAFINDFLQKEVKKVCRSLGLKQWPYVKFKKADVLDDSDTQKLVTRMMELGIITPEQGLNTIHTGEFPKPEDLEKEQVKFLEQRKLGHYTPIVNSINLHQEEFNQEMQEESLEMQKEKMDNDVKIQQQSIKNKSIVDNSKQSQSPKTNSGSPSRGRPIGASDNYSAKNIIKIGELIGEFSLRAEREFGAKYGLEFNEEKKELISQVVESIISSSDIDEWDNKLLEVVEDQGNLLNYNVKDGVLSIANDHLLTDLSAAILYHSQLVQDI